MSADDSLLQTQGPRQDLKQATSEKTLDPLLSIEDGRLDAAQEALSSVKIENTGFKHEDVGGDITLSVDDEKRPILNRASSFNAEKREPILWNDAPSASEEAALAFQELDYCSYQSATLGSTGQEEVMSCDCKPEIGPDGENYACGEESDCINRLTSMECTDEDCNCGMKCANQRFQLREYANVDVFHAGRKGYGLRALSDLDKDTFVYEYVGEVINEKRFRQRQIEYEKQGEKHFYFMMLQKGEYIDATKKGGFGRFINHSCEPNCYVDKWVVGNKLRMGIFTKKAILTGEELSFDYNVDRYGGEATPCYCGESTCIGYIGGKTQTEAANKLPQSVVEALGLDDADDWDDAKPKSNRRRKKGQDDEEYVDELVPRGILEKDVPKIMAALLQANERWLVKKLLQRISNDGNDLIQSKIVALHGYQTLGAKIEKWKHDGEISTLVLQVLQKWPTITKNKIMSSKIETHVKAFLEDDAVSQSVKDLSTQLLETWSTLEMAYRIPRRVRPVKIDSTLDDASATDSLQSTENIESKRLPLQVRSTQRARGLRLSMPRTDQPWRRHDSGQRHKDRPYSGMSTPLNGKPNASTQPALPVSQTSHKIDPISQDLQAIIDAATKKQHEQAAAQKLQEEMQALAEAARLKEEADKRADRARRHEEHKANKERRAAVHRHHLNEKGAKDSVRKRENPSLKSREDEAKRLERMLAMFVPNTIAKYQDKMDKDQWKKRAKEIVKLLVTKEMKRDPPYMKDLSDSRKSKIKAYSREFMEKVLARASNKQSHSKEDQHAPNSEQSSPEAEAKDAGLDTADSPDDSSVQEDVLDTPASSLPSKRALDEGGQDTVPGILKEHIKQARIA